MERGISVGEPVDLGYLSPLTCSGSMAVYRYTGSIQSALVILPTPRNDTLTYGEL